MSSDDEDTLFREISKLQDILSAKDKEIAQLKQKLASSWQAELDQQVELSKARGVTEKGAQRTATRAQRSLAETKGDATDASTVQSELVVEEKDGQPIISLSSVHQTLLRELLAADRISSHSRAEFEGILRSRAFAQTLVRKMTNSFASSTLSSFLLRHQTDFSRLFASIEAQLEKEVQLVYLGTQNFKITAAMRATSARACALVVASHQVRAPLTSPLQADAKVPDVTVAARVPVFYVPEASQVLPWLLDFAASHYCVVREVPLRLARAGPQGMPSAGMDLGALAGLLEADAASSALVPCAVLAFLGLPADTDVSKAKFEYYTDDLWNIRKLCTSHDVWMHVEGSSIPFATARSTPPFGLALSSCADSFCVSPKRSGADATLLFLRHTGTAHHSKSASNISSPKAYTPRLPGELPVLPKVSAAVVNAWLHFIRQPVGAITEATDAKLELASNFKRLLQEYAFIQDRSPPQSMHPHVTAFQATHPQVNPLSLNDWLGSVVTRPVLDELGIRRNEEGLFVFEVSPTDQSLTRLSALKSVLGNMERHIRWLAKAMEARPIFERRLAETEDLEYVAPESIPGGVVGVGAFRFLPSFSVPLEHKSLFSTHLADALSRQRANVYQRAETMHGSPCIVVHTDSSFQEKSGEEAVEAIVAEILQVARKLKLPKEVEEDLQKVVSFGIKEAEHKLREKLDNAYSASAVTDSLLRSVPLVGSVYGWLLPSSVSPADLSSQTFDIRSQMLAPPTVRKANPQLPAAAAGASTSSAPASAASSARASQPRAVEEQPSVAQTAATTRSAVPPPPPGPPPPSSKRWNQATQFPSPAKPMHGNANNDEHNADSAEEAYASEEYTDDESNDDEDLNEETGGEEASDEESETSLPHISTEDRSKTTDTSRKAAVCTACKDSRIVLSTRVLSSGMHQKYRKPCPECCSIPIEKAAAFALPSRSNGKL